jgi:hypothetical protein
LKHIRTTLRAVFRAALCATLAFLAARRASAADARAAGEENTQQAKKYLYGPDASALRAQFHTAVTEGTRQMWAAEAGAPNSNVQTGDALYVAIQALTPQSDTQRTLKAQTASLAVDLGELRSLMHAQSLASISRPLLVVVVVWLVIIFFISGPFYMAVLISRLVSMYSSAPPVAPARIEREP